MRTVVLLLGCALCLGADTTNRGVLRGGDVVNCTMAFSNNRKGCIFASSPLSYVRSVGAQPVGRRRDIRHYLDRFGGDVGYKRKQMQKRNETSNSSPAPMIGGYSIEASEVAELNAVFAARRVGYNGADVMASFPMPPPPDAPPDAPSQQTLWLLGDTFIGETQPSTSTRLPGYFVRNAVALVPNWPLGEKGARSDDVQFHWNQSTEGCHVSLFRLPDSFGKGGPGADECANEGEYLWPLSGLGVRLAADGSNTTTTASSSTSASGSGASKLILLAAKWGYVPNIAQVNDLPPRLFDFNFEVRGSVLVIVDNPHDPPRQWAYRVKDIPRSSGVVTWHAGLALSDGERRVATSLEDSVWILGSVGNKVTPSEGQEASKQVLARARVGDLLDLRVEALQGWGEDDTWHPLATMDTSNTVTRHSTAGGVRPKALYSPVYTATSLQYNPVLACWYTVGVDFLSAQVLLTYASAITGPWHSLPVHKIPAPFNAVPDLMAYSGKAHPELAVAENGEDSAIVLTYIVNSPGMVAPLFEPGGTRLYVPRFVRLTLRKKEGGQAQAAEVKAGSRGAGGEEGRTGTRRAERGDHRRERG